MSSEFLFNKYKFLKEFKNYKLCLKNKWKINKIYLIAYFQYDKIWMANMKENEIMETEMELVFIYGIIIQKVKYLIKTIKFSFLIIREHCFLLFILLNNIRNTFFTYSNFLLLFLTLNSFMCFQIFFYHNFLCKLYFQIFFKGII